MSDQLLTVSGIERKYRIHLPNSQTRVKAIVLVIHGGGGEGLDVANLGEHVLSVFRTVADRENFVAVYPGGLPAADATGKAGWVDCRADNKVASAANDLGFLESLITRLSREFDLPFSQIFIAGGSNGAQMAHAFAFNHAELIGALATSSGSLPLNPLPGDCTTGPKRPVPIVLLHGTDDSQMPWSGGCVANIGGACNRGRVISAEATRDRWLSINGLSNVTPTSSTIDLDPAEGGSADRFQYEGAAPVQWWRLNGAGHTGPSRTVLVSSNVLTGKQNRDIEFAEIAWSFFAERLK